MEKQPVLNQSGGQGQSSNQKDTKTAVIICYVISAITILTIIIGLITRNPYWVIAGIIPAAFYEAWRTEGFYTKTASAAIAILVILEILALMGKIQFNISQLFDNSYAYIAGQVIPLGDIRYVFPIIAVILSIMLVRRTYGKYTKWLSILLIASSIILLFMVNKGALLHTIQHFIY